MIDTRVWMYRAGEARCFPSPDAVPAGKGWADRPGASPPAERPEEFPLEALRARALALGVSFRVNTSAKTLSRRIAEAERHGP